MWRDLWEYVQALRRQWGGLLAGPGVTLVLLIWQVFEKTDIAPWVFWVAAAAGVPVAGFLAWREERAKVAPPKSDPDMERRRQYFEKEIAKLSAQQQIVLQHVVQVGDCDTIQLQEFFRTGQDKDISASEGDQWLTAIADMTGLLNVKAKVNAYARYAIKPEWAKLLVEWAAPPTAVDIRIADQAQQLRRQLAATFETWPNGLSPHAFYLSYHATEPSLREIIGMRADASHRVRQPVGTVRDTYYAAANILLPIARSHLKAIGYDESAATAAAAAKEAATKEAGPLREAAAHLHKCIDTLDTLARG